MVIFLAAFVIKGLLTPGRPHWSDYPLLAVEGLAVLALCVVWPRNMAPILTIVFIADCAMLLSAPALIGVGIALNVALWIIAAMSWNMSQPGVPDSRTSAFSCSRRSPPGTRGAPRRRRAICKQTNAHLLATRSLLEESARDHERLRLARELHDVAGHKLTALKLNLTALERSGDARRANLDQRASQLATELLDDIRGVVAQIRQHDGLDSAPGAHATDRAAARAARSTWTSATTRAWTTWRRPKHCCAWCRRR